jgi:predicted acylesterase/phospholipase RssA
MPARKEKHMSEIDLIFEGGGAKGMVFTGALEVLLKDHGHTHARLLGTSAGAITAVSLAAGYTPEEMLESLAEKDAEGKPVFVSFLGVPAPFDKQAVHDSAIRQLLSDLNLPLVPGLVEDELDDWIAEQLAENERSRHLYSFIERGGWYSADPFVAWLERKMDQTRPDGQPRGYSKLTLKEFNAATGVELTLVAADTSWARMLLLNHRTAPDVPVVWAARMSMSVPLLWQEVEWQKEWGPYHAWNPAKERLEAHHVTGHTIVDGGLLSNFPIALFMADRPDVTAIVGPAQAKNVLGLLIDEAIPVPKPPDESAADLGATLTGSRTFKRLHRLVNTAIGAHDNMAIAAFIRHVVRLPAGGYGTTQFDMTDAERDALVDAGRKAMRTFLAQQSVLEVAGPEFAPGDAETMLANEAAATLLQR